MVTSARSENHETDAFSTFSNPKAYESKMKQTNYTQLLGLSSLKVHGKNEINLNKTTYKIIGEFIFYLTMGDAFSEFNVVYLGLNSN